MEMASAHGLALKLVEMDRLERISKNICEIISEEDKIIKSWFAASNQSKFYKVEFFNLTRRTLLFVFSQSSLEEVKKKELLRGVSVYFNRFSNFLKNNLDICKPLIEVIVDPWKNKYFSWEELFQKRIGIHDKRVQQYFCAEPEEIVLARVHWFSKQGKDDFSMVLAKNCFLFHSRIYKSLVLEDKSHQSAVNKTYKKGTASIDWYVHNLRRKKSLTAVFNELKQLNCDEGVLLVMRLRQTKLISFAFSIVQVFLMQELIRPSKFCCTKKLFTLWCILHKEQKSSFEVISEEIRKIVALHAPSSAHFYVLVDALWEQFGTKLINLYVELYIRGLTVDLNYLEAARNDNIQKDITELESHIASTFYKLSTLFIDFHERAARECMFSAFSLKPTNYKLYILQSLTLSILSNENEMKSKSLLGRNSTPLQECKCAVKCAGFCKSVKEYFLDHPILMKGIKNVPYAVVKDLVCVLESVRCICFQYNVFDWHNNATDLGDYLRDFTESKSWESDTEYASEDSGNNEENSPVKEPMEVDSQKLAAKRKSESDSIKEISSLDVGANIEVGNEDIVNKKMKIENSNQNIISSTRDIFTPLPKTPISFPNAIGMEDAIENVIRMSLDNKRQKSNYSCNTYPSVNTNLSHTDDAPEKINLLPSSKPISDTYISPYSLSNFGKKSNPVSDSNEPGFVDIKSSIENTIKQAYFSQNPPTSSHMPASSANYVARPQIDRNSVVSQNILRQKLLSSIQEKSQIGQSNYLTKPTDTSCYSKPSDIQRVPVSSVAHHISSEKSTIPYQQEALDLNCKTSVYQQVRNSFSENRQLTNNQTSMQVLQKSSTPVSDFSKSYSLSNVAKVSSTSVSSPTTNQTTMQALQNSSNSVSGFSKSHLLSNIANVSPNSSSSSVPINLVQPKQSLSMQSSHFPSISHLALKKSYVSKPESSYQASDKSSVNNAVSERSNQNMTYSQDNQLPHNDRSSVIQHTMQHVRETNLQNQLNEMEVPNQLTVSVNSNAVKQIRNVPKRITNLPPFKVNIADKSISNSSLAVSANLVIARKPQSLNDGSCQQTSSSTTNVRSVDTITIPGILASPSVIVSPWEAQHKVHGELLYKKNKSMANSSTIDKRFYKNRLPYEKKQLSIPDPKMLAQRSVNENNNNTVTKTYTSKSHTMTNYSAISLVNQTLSNASQNSAVTNKSPSLITVASLLPTSSQAAPPVSSSQPWYSEPFPKPSGRNSDVSVSSSSTNVQKSVQANIQVLSPVRLISDSKSLTLYASQRHQGKNQAIVIPTVTSTLTHRANIPVSSSAVSSSVQNTSNLSISAAHTVASNNTVVKPINNIPFSSNNRVQIRTYSTVQKPMSITNINSGEKSGHIHLVTNQISVGNQQQHHTVPDVRQQVLHAASDIRNQETHTVSVVRNESPKCSQASSVMYPEACCSPSEVNPCQSCSLPPGNSLSLLNEKKPEDPSVLSLQNSKELVLDSGLIAAISHNSHMLNIENNRHQLPEQIVSNCQFCSQPFLETDLQTHILNCPSHEFNIKSRLITDMESSFLATENPLTKSLPDVVPEQDSLFQKESFHSNIPQTKTFINEVDNKNLDDIEANAFNACMDLINNDNDLKRMVQGIDSFNQNVQGIDSFDQNMQGIDSFDQNVQGIESFDQNMQGIESFDQIDNNFLSYLPPPNTANYVSSCNNIQKDIMDVPLQNNLVLGENELNNFTSKYEPPLQMVQKKHDSVFEFTEKESETSGAAENFNIAEMIKASLQENGCSGELESGENIIKDNQKDLIYVNEHAEKTITLKRNQKIKDPRALCIYCKRQYSSLGNLKRHINQIHPNLPVKYPHKVDVPSPADKSMCDFHVENEVNSASANSLHDSSSSLNYMLNSDTKHDNAVPSTSEIDGLAKDRMKNNFKPRTTSCKFCGKILTLLYMKTHINRKHKDLVNADNASCTTNDTHVNIDVNQNLPSPDIDSISIPAVPPVLEQDIDSSTCLSVSDALKRNSSYSLTEDSPSLVESKIEENNDVKFDFNELELSKDVKTEPKIMTPKERSSVELNNPLLENMSNFRDNDVSNLSNNQLVKCLDKRQSCIVCGKSYNSTTSLNRHLRAVHNVLTGKPQKKSIKSKPNFIEMVKLEENQPVSHTNFHSDVDISQTSICTTKEIPNVTSCNNAASMVDITKEKYRNPATPNTNRNLLRAVLQSNFVKYTKSYEKSDFSVQDNYNLSDKPETSGMDRNCNNVKVNAASGSFTTLELQNSTDNSFGPKLESDDKMVPSENSATAVNHSFYSVIPSEEVNVSLDNNLQDNLNFEMPVSNLNPDIRCSNLSDSANSSYQSNEISPVSEIISNVSRCNFGGTSNIEKNAEIFEDNSLKLQIPENKEGSSSSINNDQSYIPDQKIKSEIYEVDNDHGNFFRDFEERNIQKHLSPELDKRYFDENCADFECKEEVSEFQDSSNIEHDIVDNHQDNFYANQEMIKEDLSSENMVNDYQNNLPGNQGVINSHPINHESVYGNNHNLHESQNSENDLQSFYYTDGIINTDPYYPCEQECKENIMQEDISSKGRYQVNTDHMDISEEDKINSDKDDVDHKKGILEDIIDKQEGKNDEEKHQVNTYQMDGKVNTDKEYETNCNEADLNDEFQLCEVAEKGRAINNEERSFMDEGIQIKDLTDNNVVIQDNKEIKVQESMCSILKEELNSIDCVVKEEKVTEDQESMCGENINTGEDDMSNDKIKIAHDQEDTNVKNKVLEEQNDLYMSDINQDNSLNEQDCSNDDQHIPFSSCNNEEEIMENESCGLRNTTQSPKNCVMCRFCLQNLDSMEILSKHLKEAHNIPVLKRQISEPSSPEKLVDTDEIGKLSPPKLKRGTSESDSESVSYSESAYNCPNLTQDSPDLDIYENQIKSEEKKLSIPTLFLLKEKEQKDEIAVNALSPISKNLKQETISNENMDYSSSSVVEMSNSLLMESQDSSVIETSNSSFVENQQDDIVVHKPLSTVEKVFNKEKISVKDVAVSLCDSFVAETSTCSLPEIKHLPKSFELNKCNKKPSISNICSVSSEKYNDKCSPLACDSEHLSLDLKINSCNKLKRKSLSLPNLSSISDIKPSNFQHKIQITKPIEIKNNLINSGSSDENSSLDSMFNNTNSSENTSESLSSLNNSVQWDTITINSSFNLPAKVSTSTPPSSQPKTILRSKFSGRKLIIQRLKTYEKQRKRRKSKSALFTRHKIHKPKITCNPIIMTLKKAADVKDFLKTHKQPVIQLVRLKDSDLDSLSNEKGDPVSKIPSDDKIPVVKLERIPVPTNVDKVVVINQNHFVPDLLSKKTHLNSSSMQSVEDTSSPSSFYQDSSDGGISTDVSSPLNPPAVMPVELSDNDSCSSSDSIQFLGSVSRRDKRLGSKLCSLPSAKKCFTLPSKKKCITLTSRKKCLTLPSTKKCIVVLKRIPV